MHLTYMQDGNHVIAAFEKGIIDKAEARSALGFIDKPEQATEKPKPALKVGDTIEGKEAYDTLPIGAVVSGRGTWVMRARNGFVNSRGERHGPGSHWNSRKLVSLPE